MEAQRPGVKEIVGILAVCALLLVALAHLDNAAARREAVRARRALAAQAQAQVRASRPPLAIRPVFGGAWFDAPPQRATGSGATSADGLAIALAAMGLAMVAGGAVMMRR